VPNGIVAAGAFQTPGPSVHDIAVNGRRDAFMASPAGILDHFVVELRDLDGVGVVPGREIERVPEPIVGLDRVLSDDVVRRVAVIADRDHMMARLQPRFILRLHHMTIRAGFRIVGEVGVSLGVEKGVCAQADKQPREHTDENRSCNP